MEYKELKNGSGKLSTLGFGCGPMGLYDYGDVSESDLIGAVHIALDSGFNFFDTADIYGLGTSEKILSKALGINRSKVKIITKFGVRKDRYGKTFYDNSPQWIDKALEGSLKRLKTDYIDVYQIHHHDKKIPLEYLFEILEKKCNEGKILSYGVSNITDLPLSLPNNLVSFSMEYSLCSRKYESDICYLLKKKKLNFLSWGSLGEGVLSGSYGKNSIFQKNDRRNRLDYANFHGDKFLHNLEIVKVMKIIEGETGRTIPQIAIRWIIDQLIGKTSVLLGIKKPSHVVSALGALSWKLDDKHLKMLNAVSKCSL